MNAIKTIKAIEISCFVQPPLCAWLCFVVPELAIPIVITSLVWLGSALLWQDLRWHLIRKRDNRKYIEAIEKLAEESVKRFRKEIGLKQKKD